MNTFAEGERRWTAVLFADMANFSAVTEAVGSEQVYQLVSRIFDIAIECVEEHGGKPLNFGGDSLLASFGAPVALEDASLQACRAGLLFLEKLKDEQDQLERRFGVRPGFRVGISGGNVVIGRLGMSEKMDLNIMGAPVNEASRLEALAQPGQVLISESVAAQAEGWVETRDLGLQTLKGFAAPARVYELVALKGNAARFDAMAERGLVGFVGRQEELSALENLFTPAPDALTVASISGPPGIGKSRLLHAFQTGLTDRRILLGQCNPASESTAFAPFAEILRAAAEVDSAATTADVIAALGAALKDRVDVTPLAPLFEQGQARRSAPGNDDQLTNNLQDALTLRQSILEILCALFLQAPTLVIIEDAHWLDDQSRELLDSLAESDPVGQRAALIITHRPEYAPAWRDYTLCHRMDIAPLSAEQTTALAAAHLKTGKLAPHLTEFLFGKAEGNPLFAEEILRFLRSGGGLVETDQGLDLKPGDAPEVMAGNLQHLVLRRVDAMPLGVRQLLSVLSAVGRQISGQLLAKLAPEAAITELLDIAPEAGLLEPDPTGGPMDWRFSHALLRDAIYGSLLEGQRARVHAQVADALELLQLEVNTDLTRSLAYHYSRAGNATKAAPYFVQTAVQDAKVYAFRPMSQALERVLEYLRADPSVLSEAQYSQMAITWLTALNDQGDFRSLQAVADEVLPRVRESAQGGSYDRAVAMLGMALAHTRDYQRGIALMNESISQSEARGDSHSAAWCGVSLMRLLDESSIVSADRIDGLAQKAFAAAKEHGDHRLEMTAQYLLSAHYRGRGDLNRSRAAAQKLRAFADAHGDLRAEAYANWSEAVAYQTSDEIEKSMALAAKGLETKMTDSADHIVHMAILCSAGVMASDPHQFEQQLYDTTERARANGDFNLIHPLEFSIAVMNLRMRRLAKGWSQLEQVLRDAAAVGSIGYTAFFLLIRVEIRLAIAGLLPPPAPAPDSPDRSVANPDKMSFADYVTAFKIKLTARRACKEDLETVGEYLRVRDGVVYARFLICEAALSRDAAERKEKLKTARLIAQEHSVPHLERKIDALEA